MFGSFRWVAGILAALPLVVAAADDQQSGSKTVAATMFQNSLICLDGRGQISSWDTNNLSSNRAIPSTPTGDRLTNLISDGPILWAVSGTALYKYDPVKKSWSPAAQLRSTKDTLQGLAIVEGKPLLVFASRIESPLDRGNFRVPKLKGIFESKGTLRILSLLGRKDGLWLGTGNGEWGGELIKFDPRRNKWREYNDALHYVTGITSSKSGELIVSWSMSHFGADTLIRVHGSNGKPVKEFPELDSKYYLGIAYSSFDDAIYGIESEALVRIENGNPVELAKLEGKLYQREPNAIGVVPDVFPIIPIAKETLAIVPGQGVPWVFKQGKLSSLPQ